MLLQRLLLHIHHQNFLPILLSLKPSLVLIRLAVQPLQRARRARPPSRTPSLDIRVTPALSISILSLYEMVSHALNVVVDQTIMFDELLLPVQLLNRLQSFSGSLHYLTSLSSTLLHLQQLVYA